MVIGSWLPGLGWGTISSMFSKDRKYDQESVMPVLSRAAVIVISCYIAAQIIADIASVKIGRVMGLAVDMGTYIYPITFTLRDLAHKIIGKKQVKTLIVTAGAVNLLMAFYFYLCAAAPSDPSWGLGAEFKAVLSPVWRIVIASIIAEIFSELVDTEIYHFYSARITRRHQWARVLLSNGFAIPIDNIIFSFGAFAWILPWTTVFQIFASNLLVKYAVTIASVPLIYFVPDRNSE